MLRRIVAVPLVLAVVGTTDARRADVPRMVVHDQAVSAKLVGVPLAAVLDRLAAETGADVIGEPAEPRDVTLRMRRVPIDEALTRLLGSQSFTLTYDGEGALRRIRLGGGATAATPVRAAPGAWPSGQPPDPARAAAIAASQRVAQFVHSREPVHVTGRLAQFLGTDTAAFVDVLRAALKSEDRRVRDQARRLMVERMAADAEIRTSLAATVAGMPPESLVAFLRGVAGVDAQELAGAFARYGGSPEVADAMRRAIDVMRAQPAGIPPPH